MLEQQMMDYSNGLKSHVVKTFLWMILGLGVSAITAYLFNATGLLLEMLINAPMLSIALIIAQLAVAILFSARLMKMSAVTAKILYFAYAILLGISLSSITYVYDFGTVSLAFGICVIYFACLVFIGYNTKVNLLRFGPILFVGLIVLIIAEVVLMILNVGMDSMILTGAGLILFTAITAYDTQKMKALYNSTNDENMLSKLSIYSAFELYLDFINIFLYILRLLDRN